MRAGESVDSRAGVLQLIVEDPYLGGLRGSQGVRVDSAAARALMALGEPHASQLSSAAVAALRLAPAPSVLAPAMPEEEDALVEEAPTPLLETLPWPSAVGYTLLGLGVVELILAPRAPLPMAYGLLTGIGPIAMLLSKRDVRFGALLKVSGMFDTLLIPVMGITALVFYVLVQYGKLSGETLQRYIAWVVVATVLRLALAFILKRRR